MMAHFPTKQPPLIRWFPALAQHGPLIWRLTACAAFLVAAAVWAGAGGGATGFLMGLAAGVGAYMALNIGANDVANNIGPTVGARVIPLGAALVMAAVCEAAGAIIAGGDVVGTIRKGIIDPSLIPNTMAYVRVMLAALLAAALWLNLATMIGAPVSTTHSIVGGVLGAGIAAAGFGVVDWGVMGGVAASWVLSPALGAGLAAMCLYLVKRSITWSPDKLSAAQRGVPVLAAAMAWAFTTYLMLKGLSKITDIGLVQAMLGGLVAALPVWALMRAHVARRLPYLRNCKGSVNRLLAVPLVLAAGSLSFAHGSNDVANAIGPLAGIFDALSSGTINSNAGIPLWIMALGAIGLAAGLVLFGPRLVRTIGGEITRLDAIRAYCIAMAATLTVILASQLGMPVSTTHVTVGAILGVGFLRERLKAQHQGILAEIRANHGAGQQAADRFIDRFHATPFTERAALLADLKARNGLSGQTMPAPKPKHALVDRAVVLRIIAAWLVTVPAAAAMASLIYFTLRGIMLP
ncbi:inorganic phosphate transporter [Aliiroseovarius sediminis]|uniref:inorganic phosphate transporter n=1 Tax=Aliiroseovarius sediminis TaxID=2925839 RepID=UPI001F582192|nr:inorganic phosphate transporter [Aliiroseovarius sediminis]MCI2393821.1 inorganic phosphate transporter [Aliiroseovarius sediminis]